MTIENEVLKAVDKILGNNKGTAKLTSTFDELKADSLDIVEIIMEIEESLSIEINDDAIDNLDLVSDLVGYVQASETD